MPDDALHLRIGASLCLQRLAPGETPRETVRVIGAWPGESLVVTTPRTAEGRYKIVREGQRYKVRMLHGDRVVGFASAVLAAPARPYPHLHLEYPREFEQIVVRKAARVPADIECRVRNTRQPDAPEHFHPARIADLSKTGARLMAGRALGEPGDLLQLIFSLELLGQVERLSVVCSLCACHEEGAGEPPARIRHGVEFRALNRLQQILLHAWVMERLATGEGLPG